MAGNEETVLLQSPSAPTTGWQEFLAEKSTIWKSSQKRPSGLNALNVFIRKSKKQWSKLSEDERFHYSTLDTEELKKRRKSCRERLVNDLDAEIDSTSSMCVIVELSNTFQKI